MSDNHLRFFSLYLLEQDGRPLDPGQRAELQAHLQGCADCRADQAIYRGLHAGASGRWQAAPAPVAIDRVLRRVRVHNWMQRAAQPVPVVVWVMVALLALVLFELIVSSLRPVPAVMPPAGPTPTAAIPTAEPSPTVQADGKIPVPPLLQGEPAGRGSWSPDGAYFFVPLLEKPAPGGDWRTTGLHFISAATGEDCQPSETFLGPQGFQSYAWLDSRRLLFIDNKGQAHLFTPCQAQSQDLSDRFFEPLKRIALPFNYSELVIQGPLLLEGTADYWILDPATLQGRALADPLPAVDGSANFAIVPGGNRLSVFQQVADKPGLCRLDVVDLVSGQKTRSAEVDAGSQGCALMVEWLGPERPFIWDMGASGPLMLDLSTDPPKQVRVMPDLFSLSLTYPDEMAMMGVFYSPADGSYHIVAHINKSGDQSIYVYHGESGKVEKLAGDLHGLLILPGGQKMPLDLWMDTPGLNDDFDLLWLDGPQQPRVHFQVGGHLPRKDSRLISALVPGGKDLIFASSQGISLVGLPGGDTQAFWQLEGAEDPAAGSILSPSPDGRAVIATVSLNPDKDGQSQGSLLYWLSLEK